MTFNLDEFNNVAGEKFDFLVSDYGFKMTVTKAQGTYHSEIVFATDDLKITTGIWGQGNELWIIFSPLTNKDFSALHFPDVLNGLTADETYFRENIEKKLSSPIFAQSYPEYFELCVFEMRKHCEKLLTRDFSQWEEITERVHLRRKI